ncbi:MAG: YbhB/YbcL family Raf kinase inhibitor-like protein [Lachnospiraceae bacterium]|nr:YbhB/YbcL family Raf kinase inhibitor-like protein [Lachnospiraceae bacterium]
MRIVSEVMNGGEIPARFGKYGTQNNSFGVPSCSVPFEIEDAPEGTKSFAVVLDDVDSVPVCGFVWLHWIAANIKKTRVPENDSVNADYVQGTNSWLGTYGKEGSAGYGGMTPPDRPHVYTLKVYALDTELDLEDGFFYNALVHAMKGHVLASAEAEGTYRN